MLTKSILCDKVMSAIVTIVAMVGMVTKVYIVHIGTIAFICAHANYCNG
jgi:hypothetical protein